MQKEEEDGARRWRQIQLGDEWGKTYKELNEGVRRIDIVLGARQREVPERKRNMRAT